MNSRHRLSTYPWLVSLAMLMLVSPALGQASRRATEPEKVILNTKDGVRLGVTYYRSLLGREAVPIVILHGHKESRTVFNSLASALQSPTSDRQKSHAVLTVDLRGHGSSTTVVDYEGRTSTIDAAKLQAGGFADMVNFDMEAVRQFLVDKNDAQELNLNKLCLIGTGTGANVALIWAAVDWDAPRLAQRKQGQDVKALVLVSPIWRQKGLPLVDALRQPGVQRNISVMLAYGSENSKAAKDAANVYKNLIRFHPEPPIDRVAELKDLFEYPVPTTLQGSPLLMDPRFKMLARLDDFLLARLTNQDYSWIARRSGE